MPLIFALADIILYIMFFAALAAGAGSIPALTIKRNSNVSETFPPRVGASKKLTIRTITNGQS